MNLKKIPALLIVSGALFANYAIAGEASFDTQSRVQATLTGAVSASAPGMQQTSLPATDAAADMRRVLSGHIGDSVGPHRAAPDMPREVAGTISAAKMQRVLLGQAG